MHDQRLARVESELSSEQKVLAWLEQVRPLGLGEDGMRFIQGELHPQVHPDDEPSLFLYHLILNCNMAVFELLREDSVGRLVIVYLNRLEHTRAQPVEAWEAKCLHRALVDFVVAIEAAARAVHELSVRHLGGRPILLCDGQECLNERQKVGQTLLTCYRMLSAVTALPAISPADFEAKLQEETHKLVETIEGGTRARVQVRYGNILAAKRTMASIPVLKWFESTRHQTAARPPDTMDGSATES